MMYNLPNYDAYLFSLAEEHMQKRYPEDKVFTASDYMEYYDELREDDDELEEQ